MARGRGIKLENEYQRELGKLYARTPKAVLAAVAVSHGIRLEGEECDAQAILLDEWRALYECGIVPQKPPAA